ncbi:hypothetical protein A33M_1994 [Rhodovulum sp. PH10]|uniref:hypothetical protein n=1 Tax=Rhodovulum sp. PH10 TaxID=1187851 RepID=UPI00027C2BE1|nr:hypothetical protein [Rhodovulum sp. PH10]EJW12423.1 hypothetical protein A33M_1994 [Rhodovulum sp. PH10]
MSLFSDRRFARPLAGAVLLAALLAGCSDLYYDRRETIAFGAADAVASNVAIHTADPWPPYAADRNLPTRGTSVAIATELYRRGKVTKPVGLRTAGDASSKMPDAAPTTAAQTSGGETLPKQ